MVLRTPALFITKTGSEVNSIPDERCETDVGSSPRSRTRQNTRAIDSALRFHYAGEPGTCKMKRFILPVCGFFLVTLSGCFQESSVKTLAGPEDEAEARKYIDLLREDNYEAVRDHLGPGLELDRDTFEKMRALIPAGEPSSITVVGN